MKVRHELTIPKGNQAKAKVQVFIRKEKTDKQNLLRLTKKQKKDRMKTSNKSPPKSRPLS